MIGYEVIAVSFLRTTLTAASGHRMELPFRLQRDRGGGNTNTVVGGVSPVELSYRNVTIVGTPGFGRRVNWTPGVTVCPGFSVNWNRWAIMAITIVISTIANS